MGLSLPPKSVRNTKALALVLLLLLVVVVLVAIIILLLAVVVFLLVEWYFYNLYRKIIVQCRIFWKGTNCMHSGTEHPSTGTIVVVFNVLFIEVYNLYPKRMRLRTICDTTGTIVLPGTRVPRVPGYLLIEYKLYRSDRPGILYSCMHTGYGYAY